MLIGVIAAMLIGPERLPQAAEALARFARNARGYVQGAKTKVKEEMGDEFEDLDWRKLDPRQYDPRRIIREALLDDPPVPTVRAAAAGAAIAATTAHPDVAKLDGPTPFDNEAT